MEFLPIGRGSPEKRSTVNTNKRAKSRQELEEEILKWREACTRARKERRDAVSKLKNEEEEHGATKAAARQKLERLENDFKSARDSNENTKRTLKSTEREIARLRSEAHRTKEEFQAAENASLEDIAHLTSDVDLAKQELYEEKSSARKEIAQLRSQIKVLSEKNDKFRQMLIPVAEKQVLDAEVVQKFTSLRSSILTLVRRTWKLTFPEGFDLRSLSQSQKDIFKLGSMDSYDRLRYAVFQFIFHGIIGPRNYFLKDGFEQTEQGLEMAEQELFSKSSVGEWQLLSQPQCDNVRRLTSQQNMASSSWSGVVPASRQRSLSEIAAASGLVTRRTRFGTILVRSKRQALRQRNSEERNWKKFVTLP